MSRGQRWSLALVTGLAIAGLLLVAVQPPRARASADFTVLYSAGRLVLSGHADRVYDQAWLGPVIRRVAGGVAFDSRLPFNEPLAALLPFSLLAALPATIALRVWQGISLLLLVAAIWLLQSAAPLGRRATMLGVLGLLAAAPTWSTLIEGQVSAVLLLGASLVAVAVLRGRPAAALAGAALLAIKPQYLLPALAVLVVLRKPRLIAGALLGAGAVLMSPLMAGGVPALEAMIRAMLGTDQVTPVRLSESWAGWLAGVLPARFDTPVALAIMTAAAIAILWVGPRLRGEPLALLAVAGWAGVLASPHCLPHDLVLLAVPAWCAAALHRESRLPSPLPALVLCDAALVIDELGPPVLLAPALMTAALILYAVAFRRRRAAQIPAHRGAAA
ncbi:MAG TPA: glycosyltransferase 87 family protein [Candidatus Limnocylindrales bacterium]|nr:glycosyltransferase 87 family protein [Candidatus Limnocylindrales bacterium]